MTDVVTNTIDSFIGLIAVLFIFVVGVVVVGGHVKPMIDDLFEDQNDTMGFNQEHYGLVEGLLYNGLKIALWMLVGGVFLYLAIKLLAEREYASTWV